MAGTVEPSWVVALGAVPGVLGLLGGAVAFWRSGVRAGHLEQRLADVEKDVADMKGMGETVARIDERTKGTQVEMTGLRAAVDRFVEVVLQERRSFSAETPPRRRG